MKKFICVLLILALCGCSGGGWRYKTETLTDETIEIFNKAIEASKPGFELKPIEIIGRQVVSGENYCYSCQKTENGKTTLVKVTVYCDLQGNCEIIEIK